MAELAALTTCRDIIKARPSWALWNFLAASIIGIGMAVGFWYWIEASKPHASSLINLELREGVAGAHWLVATYEVNSPGLCIRQAVRLLSRENGDGTPDFFDLDAALNGAGLTNVHGKYHLWFHLPAGLPEGRWKYIARTMHLCPPFGMVRWVDPGTPADIVVP